MKSKPEVLVISDGISLSDNLKEYKDAEDLIKIREKISKTGRINFLDNLKMEKLTEEYGLIGEYNLL